VIFTNNYQEKLNREALAGFKIPRAESLTK